MKWKGRSVTISETIAAVPWDVAAAVGWVLLAGVVNWMPYLRASPLRVLVGLPLLLFFPGYVLIRALYPEAAGPSRLPTREPPSLPGMGNVSKIDGIERFGLSVVTSVVIVAFTGFVLSLSPWGIRLVPIVAGLGVITLLLAVVATLRHHALPTGERFAAPSPARFSPRDTSGGDSRGRRDVVLNILLALSVLLAGAGIAHELIVPDDDETFTEFYLLTQDDAGNLTADDYPTSFNGSEPRPLVFGIENHESKPMDYTVVVELQELESRDGSTVVDEAELDRVAVSVPPGETVLRRYFVSPTLAGNELRLTFLLYRDDPPGDPSIDNAYRETHLWISVGADE